MNDPKDHVKIDETFAVTKEPATEQPSAAGKIEFVDSTLKNVITLGKGASMHLDSGASITAGEGGMKITTASKFTVVGEADHSKQISMIGDAEGPLTLKEAVRILDARDQGKNPKAATVADIEAMAAFQQQISAAQGMAFNNILDILNVMLDLDAEAVSKLLQHRVPIGTKMATTEHDILIGCDQDNPSMSVLGLLNTCLLAGFKRRIAATVPDNGNTTIQCFTKYDPPSQQASVPSLDEPANDTVSTRDIPGPLND